jgi:anaphase-promoting complex subunit 2
MLVGIYGSKDLFVNEYRIMLADKLLGNTDFNTDREVHNLELLKLRFGEASMRQCEVMIKDIDDSKRIQTNIHSTLAARPDEPAAAVVDAAIVSHIFWPALASVPLTNHPRIQSRLDQFGKEYAKLKNPRRLVWMKQLGTVELEVEAYEEDAETGRVVSRVKEVTCTPAHATLLAHFEDRNEWTAAELAERTGMPEAVVRKKMGFWASQRVVLAQPAGAGLAYRVAAVDDADARDHSFQHEDEDEERAVSLGAHEEEEMKVYGSYIAGMLSNLGQLPLERIHTMLGTFVVGSDHKYDKTPRQLAAFLQQLCKEKKLECSPDGLYTIMKKR